MMLFRQISTVLFLFILTTTTGFSQKQTLFVDKDFDTVTQQAKTEKKPVVLMFYATWCVHCNKMKNEIFTQPEVIATYSQNYLCVASDIESKEGIALRERFKSKFIVTSFPTFVFFDSNQNVTNVIAGEFKPEYFIKEATANLNPENHLKMVQAKFENDPSNQNVALSYIMMTKRLGFNPTPIAQKHLKTVAPENYYTESNWRLFSNGITDFNAPEFVEMIKNRALFEKGVAATRIDKKINFVINETFKSLADKQDTVNYKKNRIIAENFHLRKVDSLLFLLDLNLYENTQNWKAYNKTSEKYMPEFGLKDANLINTVCGNYFMFIDDKKMLANAVSWQKEAIKLSPSLNKYILISNLLAKMKDYKQGLEYANQGKEMAQSLGFNTAEIDKIILEIKSKT